MIYRNAIVLVTLAVSSNGFWFGNDQKIEPQPTVKQVPVGYFRAFTYQPFPFNPQAPNQYLTYAGGKMLQPNSMYSYPKTGLPAPMYGPVPSNSLPPPPSTHSAPAAAPTQTTQQQTPPQSPPASPTTSTTGTQPQPSINDVQPPTTVPAQFTSSNPHAGNSPPMRPMPFIPEPVNLQYITNVAPVPLQQIQFVPCMCPVAVSITTSMNPPVNPELIANKRSDDIQISADYRDTSIGEQTLSEER